MCEAPMASGWYCKVMGQLLGPIPLQQVMELAQDGTLMPGDMVRKKTGEWVVANTIRGLFPAAATGDGAGAADASAAGSDDGAKA
jgi:hypothetical protein